MKKFEIIRNDESEILVKLLDEEEVEIWRNLMEGDSGYSHYVCDECGATFDSEAVEPLVWTPKFPETMPIAFNVASMRCPFCHSVYSEEYVVYGEPFTSIDHLGKRIKSGEVDGTPLCK